MLSDTDSSINNSNGLSYGTFFPSSDNPFAYLDETIQSISDYHSDAGNISICSHIGKLAAFYVLAKDRSNLSDEYLHARQNIVTPSHIIDMIYENDLCRNNLLEHYEKCYGQHPKHIGSNVKIMMNDLKQAHPELFPEKQTCSCCTIS